MASATTATIVAMVMSYGAAASAAAPRAEARDDTTVPCASEPGQRRTCAADTSAGVALVKSTGPAACLLGKTWGYDNAGIWVTDGCGGEFVVGQTAPAAAAPDPVQPIESWGEFAPGEGFLIGRSSLGELSISAYALLRYVNQLPAEQVFTDHLGNERVVDPRNDLFSHRVIVFLKGWVGVPKLVYNVLFWTVNTTDQDAIFGNLGYQFSRKFSVYGGINGNPGTRSLQGSHPYWLGHDRVMADEFFRPYFTFGVWTQGEPVPGLWYNVMVGNNSSALGIPASQLDRKFTTGGSIWWMPTTHEFGPRGAYGDWESHEKVAIRFGASVTRSPEERFTDPVTGGTGNTTLRLADSLNLFETGSLAPGVTVNEADYLVVSFDAGLKYRGFFLQTEVYARRLNRFRSDGALPIASVADRGFFIQGAFFPVRKKLEVYGVTSQIFGDRDAGFGRSAEYGAGINFYPAATRNHRFNAQVLGVDHSPASSTFGYYVGGQTGPIVSAALSIFF
jgi:hypothetical protein